MSEFQQSQRAIDNNNSKTGGIVLTIITLAMAVPLFVAIIHDLSR